MAEPVLSLDEVKRVILAALARPGSRHTEEELARAVAWAEEARIGEKMLVLVLAGRLGITIPPDGGELLFWKRGI